MMKRWKESKIKKVIYDMENFFFANFAWELGVVFVIDFILWFYIDEKSLYEIILWEGYVALVIFVIAYVIHRIRSHK